MMRRNPRKTSWTVLYRRKHRKGTIEESSKKRSRRTVKHTRAIQGASLQDIMMKRNQKPEVRKAQREQALRAAKAKIADKKERQRAVKVCHLVNNWNVPFLIFFMFLNLLNRPSRDKHR